MTNGDGMIVAKMTHRQFYSRSQANSVYRTRRTGCATGTKNFLVFSLAGNGFFIVLADIGRLRVKRINVTEPGIIQRVSNSRI
ncbi:hypothetical protein DRV69_24840 [Salmonella enterica subsp. diarizonae]|nr:hypothetical protein [Salmonella enterica subsp. diarizonae]